ncbi:MAG: ATP-binding protein, partial [Thermodesulfobacteriota bacterium]
EECIGRTSIELNLWANPAGRDYYVAKLREKGRVLNLEADFRTQSGEIRNCLVSGEFVEIQGAPHILGVIRDITERKRAEEEIRQLNEMLEQRVKDRTAELEEANRDLESFSYSVSHDLRAPLRAISGFAEIIARRHRASLNEEGQRYFDNIIEGSAQMGRLIDDLLKYSRLGRRALSLQAVNPLVILRQVTKTLADRIEGLGAKIVIPGTIPAVQGDPTLVEQIFANLVENALLYRRSGVAPIVEVTGTAADGHVVIEVSDNGIGISPEYHQKIFNMFQRLHSYDDYPGTGIGLAIVRKSANLMDGDVWVESEPGCGSRFFVKLIQAKKPAETE